MRAQLALAAQDGALLRYGERVREIAQTAGLVHVTTESGTYAAKQAIIAAGAWLPGLLEGNLARHFAVTRQVLYWYALDAPLETFLPPRFPVWIWELQERSNVIYGFPALDGAEGGVKIATEQYAAATTPETYAREVSAEEIRAMHGDLVAPYLPALAATCVKASACLYTATPDFHFVIDRHPRMTKVILASPCSGHGFKHSAAIGEALAQWVIDGRSTLDLGSFSLARFAGAAD